MGQDFTMICPQCGKVFPSREWGNAGAPQKCPNCGRQMELEWFGEDEPEHEHGRNGVNFGQDW